jgi:hypothetical protein
MGGPAFGRGKRVRGDAGDTDIVYGPAVLNAFPTLDELAATTVGYLSRVAADAGHRVVLTATDIVSTRTVASSPDFISIRFKSREKAALFVSLVQQFTPLPGQTAYFRTSNNANPGVHVTAPTAEALLNALKGNGGAALR